MLIGFIVAVSPPTVLAVGTGAGVGIVAAAEVAGLAVAVSATATAVSVALLSPAVHATATIEASNSFAGVMVKRVIESSPVGYRSLPTAPDVYRCREAQEVRAARALQEQAQESRHGAPSISISGR